MNEELLADVDELPVDDPGIQLMEEYSVAREKNLGEHILDDGISTGALLI